MKWIYAAVLLVLSMPSMAQRSDRELDLSLSRGLGKSPQTHFLNRAGISTTNIGILYRHRYTRLSWDIGYQATWSNQTLSELHYSPLRSQWTHELRSNIGYSVYSGRWTFTAGLGLSVNNNPLAYQFDELPIIPHQPQQLSGLSLNAHAFGEVRYSASPRVDLFARVEYSMPLYQSSSMSMSTNNRRGAYFGQVGIAIHLWKDRSYSGPNYHGPISRRKLRRK